LKIDINHLLVITERDGETIVELLEVSYSEGLLPPRGVDLLMEIGRKWPHLVNRQELAIRSVFEEREKVYSAK